MSPAVPSSNVDIDLASWARRVLARWYIIVACVVVAIVIASLGANSGHKVWTARSLVNLGQPYTSSNTPIAASLGTNPSAASTLLKQDFVVKLVADKVGLRPGQLKEAISTQPVGQPNVKANYTPLVNVIVSGPWKNKVTPAANLLAQQLIKLTSGYQSDRLAAVTTQVNQEAAQLKALAIRDKAAVKTYQGLLNAQALSPFEKTLAINSAIGLLSSIETRQQVIGAQHAEDLQTVAQIKKIEFPTVVTRAVRVQTTAASKRAGYAVAILLGAIVGVLLALLSYAAWPARRARRRRVRVATPENSHDADFLPRRPLTAIAPLVSVDPRTEHGDCPKPTVARRTEAERRRFVRRPSLTATTDSVYFFARGRTGYSSGSTFARVCADDTTGTISNSASPGQCSTHCCSRLTSSHSMSWKQRPKPGSTQLST